MGREATEQRLAAAEAEIGRLQERLAASETENRRLKEHLPSSKRDAMKEGLAAHMNTEHATHIGMEGWIHREPKKKGSLATTKAPRADVSSLVIRVTLCK